MADKSFLENIFNRGLSSIQIQDQNFLQHQKTAFECVKQFQVIYDDKNNLKARPTLEQITTNLVESINKINSKFLQNAQLKNELNQVRNELTNVKSELQKVKQQLSDQNQMQLSNDQIILIKKDEEIVQLQEQLRNEIQNSLKKKNTNDDSSIDGKKKYEYDITIDVKSLLDIQTEPVQIKYPENSRLTKKDLSEMDQCSVVGIQGLKNKGKTFLLNELNGENFPSGFHHSTSGISVKIDNSDPNNIKVYLDSEGINKPARYKWNEDQDFQQYIKNKMENLDEKNYLNTNETQLQKKVETRVIEKFQDIKSTEQIQQQFLLQHSETIIIVVGIISLEEQKIISIISEVCDKDIIVVHNLKEYSKIKHVEDEIKNNLNYYFPLDQQGIDLYRDNDKQTFNCVYQDQRNEKIFHCILAKKGSPAGDYYNQFTYDFIKQKIQLNQVKKSINIVNDFYVFLNKILRDFVNIKYSSEKKMNSKISPQEELLSFAEGKKYDEITLKSEFTVESIKDILLDVFGRIRNSVNYSISQQDNIKTVEVELPGDVELTKANLIIEEEYSVLVIVAVKKTTWLGQDGIFELFNNRNLGQITQKIKVGKTTESLKLRTSFSSKKGVYTCQFEITNCSTALNFGSN